MLTRVGNEVLVGMGGRLVSTQPLVSAIPSAEASDRNGRIDYEIRGIIGKALHYGGLVPIMKGLSLSESFGGFFFERSSICRNPIRRYATTSMGIEAIYTYKWSETSGNGLVDRLATHVWLNIDHGKGTRNRFKMVKEQLKKAISLSGKKEVKILSIGSGSARAVVEVIAELAALNRRQTVRVRLLDRSLRALQSSQKLAERCGVSSCVETVRGRAEDVESLCQDFRPDIEEMVGLLDYYPKPQAVDLVHKAYNILSPEGVFIGGNVMHNPESPFVKKIIGWQMIYRTPEELLSIATGADFSRNGCEVILEPIKLHGLLIAKKFA